MEVKWTSIDERKPTFDEYSKSNNGLFLVYDGEKVYPRHYNWAYKAFGSYLKCPVPTLEREFCRDFAVTDWMPLPRYVKE